MYEKWQRQYLDVLFELAFESRKFIIDDYHATPDLDQVLTEAASGRPLEAARKEIEAVREDLERRARRPVRPARHYDTLKPASDLQQTAELASVLQTSLANIERAIDDLRQVIEDRLTGEPDSS